MIKYILKNSGQLTITKLERLIYLSEWKSRLMQKESLFNFTWKINLSGFPAIKEDFKSILEEFSCLKDGLIVLTDPSSISNQSIIDFVILKTSSMTESEFNTLILSTYPILTSSYGDTIDFNIKLTNYLS